MIEKKRKKEAIKDEYWHYIDSSWYCLYSE